MKKTILVIFIFLLNFSSWSAVKAAKVVVLDKTRVFRDYSLVKEAYVKVSEMEKSTYRVISTAEKEIKDLEALGKKPEEIEKRRKEIQSIIDSEIAKLHTSKEAYNERINNNIQSSLEKFVKLNSIDIVIDKEFWAFGGTEMTDDFLNLLEKEKK
jgi:Skp family chaperone for outer membrane proteins